MLQAYAISEGFDISGRLLSLVNFFNQCPKLDGNIA
jgi:hypothetical protein